VPPSVPQDKDAPNRPGRDRGAGDRRLGVFAGWALEVRRGAGGVPAYRSHDKAWKTKRLRNNPQVEVAASTLRGKRTGPPVHARATLLDGEQARFAAQVLARRYRVLQGLLVPQAHRLMRYQTMHYELHADPAQGCALTDTNQP
jgi:PPOX class probable F420-dependent enzyme